MGVEYAAFAAGDVYIDFPYEEVFFRFEKATGRFSANFMVKRQKPKSPATTSSMRKERSRTPKSPPTFTPKVAPAASTN